MTSGERPAGPAGRLKFLLFAFVAASIAVAVYKTAAVPPAPAATAAAAGEEAKPAAKTPAAGLKASAAKTALVYYFYTDTRCSSCQTIEAYTKEAVEKDFIADYKGWRVAFKGVNLDEEPNAHFKQDYRLDSKSVVVQKFSGDKPLKWGKLEKVWQLLGDKAAFMEYVTDETQKLLDQK